MPRTRNRPRSKADDPLFMARKSFRSVLFRPFSRYCAVLRSSRLIPAFSFFIRWSPTPSQQPEPVQSSDSPQSPVTKLKSDSVSGDAGAGRSHRDVSQIKPKKEKKPVSISGFKSSVSATSPSTSTLPGKKPVLPASSLIYQDADVGVDLASTRRAANRGTSFIKPADVDAPPQPSQPPRKPDTNTSDGAEHKKRAKDGPAQFTDVPEDSSRKKRKR